VLNSDQKINLSHEYFSVKPRNGLTKKGLRDTMKLVQSSGLDDSILGGR